MDPIETLNRWERHGAEWRVVYLGPDRAVIDLLTCHGEQVDRLESDDAELLRFLEEHAAGAADRGRSG